jgi:ATP-binding cassette, subfamily B, bacterial PglK
MQKLKKLLYLLSRRERKSAVLLVGMILIMALIDMIGVASILPFMAVLTNPELVKTNIILNTAYETSGIFGVETNNQFLFALGIAVFLLLIISLTFKALTSYVQVRFTSLREYSIAKRLVEGYLHQPYSWFLNRHSADLGKTILSEVGIIISKGIGPMMNLITQSAVTITLLILLILVDPKLTLIVTLTLGAAYGLMYKFSKNLVNQIGKKRLKANQWRFTIINEAFGAFKELKVAGLEEIYIKRFSDPAKTLAHQSALLAIISQLPRFALEAVAFGGIVLVILYLIPESGDVINVMPVIGLYVFAGYRLMPALQKIYVSLTELGAVGPSLDAIYDDLKRLHATTKKIGKNSLAFDKSISLKNIYYNYPNTSRTALKNINFNIFARTTIGLVGATGSGKTTTVDIILSLLEPQQGTIEVDNKVINKFNRRAWQNFIGYVPQEIFLSDDSIAANIAFGVDHKEIDLKAVEHAAQIANLHKFVVDELPLQYKTTVGERGVRLSGGQRQRIGIARALYHKPKLLILDEATSALDNLTEEAVMEAVHKLRKNITIIIIAHRLSTVKKCDKIFLFNKGQLEGQGTFEELIKISNNFQATVDKI